MQTFICLRVSGVPLLAVLAHTHSSSVARRRVAAGALADLEADAAGGAAGGPGSPWRPGSVPERRRGKKGGKTEAGPIRDAHVTPRRQTTGLYCQSLGGSLQLMIPHCSNNEIFQF